MNRSEEQPSEEEEGVEQTGRIDDDELLATCDPLESYDPDLTTDGEVASATPVSPQIGRGSTGRKVASSGDFEIQSDLDQALSQLEPKARTRCEEILDRFEQAWASGEQTPEIESFVPDDLDDDARQLIARELILIDLWRRENAGEPFSKSQYLERLPGCERGVQSAFSNTGESNAGESDAGATIAQQSTNVKSGPGHEHIAVKRAGDPNSRYRPTQLHARGGLGAVFRARDQELKRVVALKEILPEHSDNPHYQDKFVFEAEVTGSLEHPGIVPVYGLGRYADNQPFYAMRFIRGHSFSESIRRFHKSHPDLTPDVYLGREFRSMLRRLQDACHALHFAHEHGVLHRDIKPANIMLGQYGETLVVDWGLAKLMSQKQPSEPTGDHSTMIGFGGNDSSKTRQGSIVGTPMYMSPEQAHGDTDSLDGRTDIYSLGAVLFHLITGENPVEGKTTLDVIKNVRSGKTRDVTTIRTSAPRPLASICEKAMALDREDRYAKATELVDDIDRWLNDELVLAHADKESALERLGRLIRRHRSWTISGFVSMTMITVISIVSVLIVNRARRNERLAKIEAQQAEDEALSRYQDSRSAIDTWLVQSSDALEFFPGSQAVRKRLLQRAVEDYEKLSQAESRFPELELERGRAMLRIGDLMRMQNEFDEAEKSYDAALQVFQSGIGTDEYATAFQAEAAGVELRRGKGRAEQGRLADAEVAYANSIEDLSKLTRSTDDAYAWHMLASTYLAAGQLLAETEPDRAKTYLENSLAAYAEAGDEDEQKVQLGISVANDTLGQILRDQGRHDQAVERFQVSQRIATELVKAEPDHPDYLQALASVSVAQASSYRTRGLQRELFETLERAVEDYRAIAKSLPGVPRHTSNLAISLTDLGLVKHEVGLNDEAEQLLDEAHELLSGLVATYGNSRHMLEAFAICNDARGLVFLERREDPGDAAIIAENLLAQLADTAESDEETMRLFEGLAIAQSHLARTLTRLGKSDLATERFEHSISRLGSLVQIKGDVPRIVNALAHVHFRYGMMLHETDQTEAEEHFPFCRGTVAWTRRKLVSNLCQ